MFLHTADISNQCKSWPVAKRWSDCIMVELFHQGDVEREQKLPMSPNSDRHSTDRVQLTLNFIDFVVAPIYVSLSELLPSMTEGCSCLRANRQRWGAILQKNISQSSMSDEKRREEDWRWKRRMESFDQILMPSVNNDNNATTAHCAGFNSARRSSLRVIYTILSIATTPHVLVFCGRIH